MRMYRLKEGSMEDAFDGAAPRAAALHLRVQSTTEKINYNASPLLLHRVADAAAIMDGMNDPVWLAAIPD